MDKKKSHFQDLSLLEKVLRFSLVGLLNSFLDFFVTNILAFLLNPANDTFLLLISIVACTFGMISSYILNKYWTFESQKSNFSHKQIFKFFLFATISMIVNSSTFLFVYQYLNEVSEIQKIFAISLSKVAGVITGSFVGFFSYCFIVFKAPDAPRF